MTFTKKIIPLFFILIFFAAPAQKKPVFNNKKLHQIGYDLMDLGERNPQLFFKKLDSILPLIPKNDKKLFSITQHYLTGSVYRNLGNFEKAIYNYEETKRLAKEHDYLWFIPEVYREMGDEYMDQDMYPKAVKSYDNAIKWYKKFGNELGVITCTYDGFVEHEQEKYEESNKILKKLLPILRKANPVYLDALSTIAQNYYNLDNVDSAFAYVNKMPLDTVEDINNFNYSIHKDYVYVQYYLEKNNAEKANYYNEILGKKQNTDDIKTYYFENKIAIAKLTNNVRILQQYSDSLQWVYEKQLKEVRKADVYTAEKVIATENKLQKHLEKNLWQKTFFVLIILVLLIVMFVIHLFYKRKRRIQEENLAIIEQEIKKVSLQNSTNTENKHEKKVLAEAQKYKLTDRETDVLLYLSKGLNNQQIADQLFVSINTIKYHIRNIYEKMDVKKRSEITSRLLLEE